MSLRAKYKQEIATGTVCPRNDTMFWPYRLRSEDRSEKAQENLTREGSQRKDSRKSHSRRIAAKRLKKISLAKDRSEKAQENLTRGGSQQKCEWKSARDFYSKASNAAAGILCVFQGWVVRRWIKRSADGLQIFARSVAYKKREQGEIRSRPANTPVLH